jgi:CBS domain-containing protein
MTALGGYATIGALTGVASVLVTRAVYAVEDAFERLPLHFMWWPAIGGLAVGLVGLVAPRTLGVGYDNIEQILSAQLVWRVFVPLCLFKFISWAVALGSGTSGGTLAPLFTIGAGLGGVLGVFAQQFLPALEIDVRVAALVGMAAIFAGASRALLASVVFAFETTRQPIGLLPLLCGCSAAYLVSCLLMRNSIMTEKIVRRGVNVVGEYTADFLEQLRVDDVALRPVVTLRGDDKLEEVQRWLSSRAPGSSHQGFPVLDQAGDLIGVLTRRDLLTPGDSGASVSSLIKRAPLVIFSDNSLRSAANRMARERIGRLPVVHRNAPRKVVGILTRSDLVDVHVQRLDEHAPAAKAPGSVLVFAPWKRSSQS